MKYFNLLSEIEAIEKSVVSNFDVKKLSKFLCEERGMICDNGIFYNDNFAITIYQLQKNNVNNKIISISDIRYYDKKPLVICVVSEPKTSFFLGNSTFLKDFINKSKKLTTMEIAGYINYRNISTTFANIPNEPIYFEPLFKVHNEIGFKRNYQRLVENKTKTETNDSFEMEHYSRISESISRAIEFVNSNLFSDLKKEIDFKISRFETLIGIIDLIENVRIRSLVFNFYFEEDSKIKEEIANDIRLEYKNRLIPSLDEPPKNGLFTLDTQILGYNVKVNFVFANDKNYQYDTTEFIEFLSEHNTIFLYYFVGIDVNKIVNTVLVSVFQTDLMDATICLKHWAGRNSRGVTQLEGKKIHKLILNPNNTIDLEKAKAFLEDLIAL